MPVTGAMFVIATLFGSRPPRSEKPPLLGRVEARKKSGMSCGKLLLTVSRDWPKLRDAGTALYDSIYQERYMGLPDANAKSYRDGSPITFAEGQAHDRARIGDDYVHFQSRQKLLNRLIR